MKRMKFFVPVLAGLFVGQLFAESERPLSVINTLRFGYNDNLYYRDSGQSKSSFFVTDIVDLSLRAVLSDRTDMLVKTQLNFLSDDGSTELYPNLYAMLNHSISPRLLLQLSEYFRSGEKDGGGTVSGTNRRYNYYENRMSASADYILDQKNRLQSSAGHSIMRNEDDLGSGLKLDYTTVDAGLMWKHDIAPQRTYSTLSLQERMTEYDNRDSSFDATDISAGIGHTFNPEWQGNLDMGATLVRPDEQGAENKNTLNPLIRAGLSYSPSPITRFAADFTSRYEESGDNRYGGQNSQELQLSAQHDLTAKLMARILARYQKINYDENASASKATSEDVVNLQLLLTYKLNRINFLEARVRHSSNKGDARAEDWEQNVVDVGWRVELR